MRRPMRIVAGLAALALLAHADTAFAQNHNVPRQGLKIDGNLAASGRTPFTSAGNRELQNNKHKINLVGGKKYRCTLESTQMDSFLIIMNDEGREVAFDDDSLGNLNSLITFDAPKDGVYKFFAACLSGGGDYVLKVTEVGGAGGDGKTPEPPPIVTTVEDADLDGRPNVYRAGKLPSGLPEWFTKLDVDEDGQIALWEWRKGGKKIEEFFEWDINEDGFITAEEVFLKQQRDAASAKGGNGNGPVAGGNGHVAKKVNGKKGAAP